MADPKFKAFLAKKKQPGLSDLTETLTGITAGREVDLKAVPTQLTSIHTITPAKPNNSSFEKKKGPPPVSVEKVRCLCGHVTDFELFAKDPHREARRKKLTDRKCKECRIKDQEINNLKARQDALINRVASGKLVKKTADRGWGMARYALIWGRLPHGSRFDVTYDNTDNLWKGTLTVPIHGEQRFEAQNRGLFRLLPWLDSEFRQWWLKNHPEEAMADKQRQEELRQKNQQLRNSEKNSERPKILLDSAEVDKL